MDHTFDTPGDHRGPEAECGMEMLEVPFADSLRVLLEDLAQHLRKSFS